MRKFELLNDLPDAKAGTILESDGGSYHYESIVNGIPKGELCYYRDYVENNPSWFKEIVEKEPFVWTDSLVRELVDCLPNYDRDSRHEIVNQFKASKQQSQSIKAGKGTAIDVLNSEDYWKERNDLIKKVSPTPSKPLNSEWEIVEFRRNGNTFRKHGDVWRSQRDVFDYTIEELLENGTIYSVKRLSDGEVFSVGDEVEYRSAENFAWDATKVWPGKIKSIKPSYNKEQLGFEIDDDYEWNDSVFPTKYIKNIRHKHTPPQPQNNKERIEVDFAPAYYLKESGENVYYVFVKGGKTIDRKYFPAIKKSIEDVIN
jgi:hypothetical protein